MKDYSKYSIEELQTTISKIYELSLLINIQ